MIPRSLSKKRVLIHGLLLGAICYLIAELVVPSPASSPGQHDLDLAQRLGLIYGPVVGCWIGWIQKSWRGALRGAFVGIVTGTAYFILCTQPIIWGGKFLLIMVAYPCLCGGLFAMALGVKEDDSPFSLGVRLGRGLVAGFVLGAVYAVVLNVAGAPFIAGPFLSAQEWTDRYVSMMWKCGPMALGLASSIFLVLMRWAIAPIRRHFPACHCQICGYNLTGNQSGICSECGTKIVERDDAKPESPSG